MRLDIILIWKGPIFFESCNTLTIYLNLNLNVTVIIRIITYIGVFSLYNN